MIQGLALADAVPIIAVDTNPAKEAAARQFGATHFIAAGPDVDTVEAVKEICPHGVDYAFECVGHPALIRQCDRPRSTGAAAACCSACPSSAPRPASWSTTLYNDKSILGCRYGTARPHHDIPLFVELYKAGRLKLDELVSATYKPEDVQQALDDMHDGKLNRGVLTFA